MKKKNKTLKQLDIVFENCEVYTLTPDMIIVCSLDGVKNNIGINCFQYEDGEIYDSISCEELMLTINKKGLEEVGNLFEDDCTLAERIQYNDITHFDVIYSDKTNDYISVPWKEKEDNEFYNTLQHNIFDKDYDGNDICTIIIDQQKLTKKQRTEKYGI